MISEFIWPSHKIRRVQLTETPRHGVVKDQESLITPSSTMKIKDQSESFETSEIENRNQIRFLIRRLRIYLIFDAQDSEMKVLDKQRIFVIDFP